MGNFLLQKHLMNFWIAGKAPLLALFYQVSGSSEFIFIFEKEL